MLKTLLLTLVLSLLVTGMGVSLRSQTNLSVATDSAVYLFIDMAEVKGAATRLSQARPYSRLQIQEILGQIQSRDYLLSDKEKRVLDFYLEKYAPETKPDLHLSDAVWHGSYNFAGSFGSIGLGIQAALEGNINANQIMHPDMRAPITFFVMGDLFWSHVSYKMNLAISFDHLDRKAFAYPTFYRPNGMGFHQSLSESDAGQGEGPGVSFGYIMSPEVGLSLWDNRIMARYGFLPRNIGPGEGLVVSDHAVPFQAFEIAVRPTEWFNFYAMVGELTDAKNDFHNTNAVQYQKMLSYHVLEFFPSEYFYFNIWESVAWGKRFEPAYLLPLNIYLVAQNLLGDVDNIALGISGSTQAPGLFKLWAALYLDELKLDFTSPRMETAVQFGLRIDVPKVPLTMFTAQYTKIEPYVYTHYPQSYPFNGQTTSGKQILTQTGYNNEGKGIGFHLKPNSDEIAVALETAMLPGLQASVGYSLIRHGSSPRVEHFIGKKDGKEYYTIAEANTTGGGVDHTIIVYDRWGINGELDSNLSYSIVDKLTKLFLRDGIYDWTNMLALNVAYDFSALSIRKHAIPVTLSLGYQFAHTFFRTNGFLEKAVAAGTNQDGAPYVPADLNPNAYKATNANVFTVKLTLFPGL